MRRRRIGADGLDTTGHCWSLYRSVLVSIGQWPVSGTRRSVAWHYGNNTIRSL